MLLGSFVPEYDEEDEEELPCHQMQPQYEDSYRDNSHRYPAKKGLKGAGNTPDPKILISGPEI